MPDYVRLAGSADVSVEVFIFDPATGLPDNTVVFDTLGLNLQYRRKGAANVAITLVTLPSLTTAHTDGGFLLIGNGEYRLDLPDAAVAAGVPDVTIHGSLTNRVIVGCKVHLVAYNPQDVVRLGLTALPNVASGSAGAIPTTGTGANQLSVSSGHVTLLDASLTATKIATDAITASKVATDAITEIQAGLSVFDATADTVLLNTATQTQIDDIETNLIQHLLGFATFGTINDATPSATEFVVSADFANVNDRYNGLKCYVLSGAQKGRRAEITDFVGSTRTLNLDTGLTAAPENGAIIAIMS